MLGTRLTINAAGRAMMKKPNCPIIAIEEHYWDRELARTYTGTEAGPRRDHRAISSTILEICASRRWTRPASTSRCSRMAPRRRRSSASMWRRRLPRRSTTGSPRFAPLTPSVSLPSPRLPTVDPKAAADELERAVSKLGFKGAMIHGMSTGEFIDLPKYWPIFERAEKLDVPIYLHPSLPNAKVTEIYYQDYAKDFPLVVRPAWGFTVETATQAIRLVLSGVFDKHPKLKIVLGHFGETLPFLVWRIDMALKRPGQKALSFRDVFCKNFYVTTCGFFSNPALLCTVMEMGVDHILFAVDWPFVADNKPAVEWMRGIPLSDDDKEKILSGNAKKLLKM